jgi:hypothetical protein
MDVAVDAAFFDVLGCDIELKPGDLRKGSDFLTIDSENEASRGAVSKLLIAIRHGLAPTLVR